MDVLQTPTFRKAVKRLHKNQKKCLDHAVAFIMKNPEAGELKRGDLAGVAVYKFKTGQHLFLLAYHYDGKALILLALGSHENFYRDLKKKKWNLVDKKAHG